VNIGIVCNNIGPNQLAYYAIKSGNEFVESGDNDLVIFFYELMPECIRPNFGVMNLSEAYNYNGVLVATDLNSATRILEYPGTRNKYFYVWDLEYLRIGQKNYEDFCNIYNNPRLPLIVRSKSHKHYLGTIWGGNVIGIEEQANIKNLQKIIEKWEKESK
jgi:hypothetical protein